FGIMGMIWGILIGLQHPESSPVYYIGVETRPPLLQSGSELHIFVFDSEVYSRKSNDPNAFQTQKVIVDSLFPLTLATIGFGGGALGARLVLGSYARFSSPHRPAQPRSNSGDSVGMNREDKGGR